MSAHDACSAEAVVSVLSRRRLPLTSETTLQVAIAECLAEVGMPFAREHRLSNGSIVDLFHDGVGIEVKIGGAKREIFRQVERYIGFDEIRELVLATNAMLSLPPLVKPVHVLNLGRAWL